MEMNDSNLAYRTHHASVKAAQDLEQVLEHFNRGKLLTASITRFNEDYGVFQNRLDKFMRSLQGERFT